MLTLLVTLVIFPGNIKLEKGSLSLTPWWWLVASQAFDRFLGQKAKEKTLESPE